jgi:hypothetical protein
MDGGAANSNGLENKYSKFTSLRYIIFSFIAIMELYAIDFCDT